MRVELLKATDTDLDVVNAARVSYDKESWWGCATVHPGVADPADRGCLKPADVGLINYLMRERHGTPFEMVDFKLRIHVPIGVSREWMRHRVGSFNEVSTRYVEMEPEFYVPDREAIRKQVGKPGHYTFEMVDYNDAQVVIDEMTAGYEGVYQIYQKLLKNGVAKELARNVLPLGLYTTFIWKVNARSLMNFLSLRLAPNALLEIRQCARQVYDLVRPVTPVTWDAWEKYRRPGGDEFHDCDSCDVHDA